MIEEEEYPEDESERKRKGNPFPVEFPEMHEPGTPMRGLKCCAHRERQRASSVEAAPICHSRGCDEGERHTVICAETAHVPVEKRRSGEKLEKESGNEHEKSKDDRYECTRGCRRWVVKLMRKDLGPILDVCPGNVEAKGITGEECDILQKVAPYIVSGFEKKN